MDICLLPAGENFLFGGNRMKPTDPFISQKSDQFFYFPSAAAKNAFFYPVCTGHFFYEKGYSIHRSSYDSLLLIYIQSGSLHVEYEAEKATAEKGNFVFLDCYKPHTYYTTEECECLWCHFDGPLARKYYEMIAAHTGFVFALCNPFPVTDKLQLIYRTFAGKQPIREVLFSKYLTDICTELLLNAPEVSAKSTPVEKAVSYINEHFAEPITIASLSEYTMLSQYHFIRLFKKETGFTPHEYLLNTRISAARYMLRYSQLTIKNICFNTGFSCESVFCTAFKKNVGMTPKEYREQPDSPGFL